MLRDPDPGDWLMIRRNYQAWSYSPLTQVNTKTVRDLRLVWISAMNENGANEPTPIVHSMRTLRFTSLVAGPAGSRSPSACGR